MIYLHAVLLLAFFQSPGVREPLRSGCSADDRQIGTVGRDDVVQVETALAGDGPKTCYKIALRKPGETTTGYVLGESLPAIAAFVRVRESASRATSEAQARAAARKPPPLAEAKADDKAPLKPLDPNAPSHIDNFSWRDAHGKPASLSGLGGRAILVTFWPADKRSRDQLDAVQPLYNRLHASGLDAVSISMNPNPAKMTEVLDDTNYHWPVIPDQNGLAAHYHVNPKVGETFVLDASHNVVAAGLMGPDIVKAVHQLLDAPEAAPASAANQNK